MPIKSFAEWETERNQRLTTQRELERQVLIGLDMIGKELATRFALRSARVEPNTVRITRADDVSLSITSKDGKSFDLSRHPPTESIGVKLDIDDVYTQVVKFVDDE